MPLSSVPSPVFTKNDPNIFLSLPRGGYVNLRVIADTSTMPSNAVGQDMGANDVMSDTAHTLVPSAIENDVKIGTREHDTKSNNGDTKVSEHNLIKAMQQLQLSLIDPNDIPILRLSAIRLNGLKNTRHGFLASLCRPYVDPTAPFTFMADLRYGHRMNFPPLGEPTTIHTILQTATSFSSDISRMDIAKDISVHMEPSRVSQEHPTEDVDLILNIKPASRFFLKTSTSVGNSEGTASIQGKIRNLFGGAESLEGSAMLGTRTKHSYNVRLIFC